MTLDNGTDGQTDGQTECDAICGPLLKEEGRIINAAITAKIYFIAQLFYFIALVRTA